MILELLLRVAQLIWEIERFKPGNGDLSNGNAGRGCHFLAERRGLIG